MAGQPETSIGEKGENGVVCATTNRHYHHYHHQLPALEHQSQRQWAPIKDLAAEWPVRRAASLRRSGAAAREVGRRGQPRMERRIVDFTQSVLASGYMGYMP